MNKQFLLDVVEVTRINHPPECIFDKDDEWIVERTMDLAGPRPSKDAILDSCTIAFREAEIYCPHEGIDRR